MPEPITCSGCSAVWTATGAAHCSAAECHRTFSTPRLFDSHRHARGDHGGCLNPAMLTNARTGDRIMFLRDGMWRNPEMPPDQRERVAALAEQRKVARLSGRR
jgi:hypothetical protein